MTQPTVTERALRLEPVTPDGFLDGLGVRVAVTAAPVDAERPGPRAGDGRMAA